MGWKLPPLNALRYFEATGRLGSMTKAAAEMNVTQVAISKQVTALEEALRVKLFTRGSRNLQLTPTGESLFIVVSRIFRDLQEVADQVSAKQQRRVLNIRGYTNFSMRWLIPQLANFHNRHPEIDIQLTSSTDNVDFERSDFDAAIRSGDGNWPHWDCTLLAPIDLMPVCSPRLLGTGQGLRHVDDLQHYPLLHSVARPHDWSIWLNAAGATAVNAYSGMKFDNGSIAYNAAIEGIGVAIAQRVLVLDDLRSGKLIAPFPAIVPSGESYYFVTPRGRTSPKVKAFRDWLVGVAQSSYLESDQGTTHRLAEITRAPRLRKPQPSPVRRVVRSAKRVTTP